MTLEIPPSWQAAIGEESEKAYFKNLAKFVEDERRAFPLGIYPAADQVFAALEYTPYDDVKVVLLGQDPYPGEGMAHGLCFSVERTVSKLPASLKNIFKELSTDRGLPIPNNGYLVPWAKQGVLLLNTILTLRAGGPLSHKGRGWEIFTDTIIRKISTKPNPVVFVLWGKSAQSKAKLLDAQHIVIEAAHPSPLSARGFLGSRPFSSVNEALRRTGTREIDWRIPNL